MYAHKRQKQLYIGRLLIPVTSLCVDPSFQRPYNDAHAHTLLSMYNCDVDQRSLSPLDCVVPLEHKQKVEDWVASLDAGQLTSFNLKEPVLLTLPGCKFPIVKGQHRYRAYCLAMEEDKLPKDALHPGHLYVDLYYLGASYRLHTLSLTHKCLDPLDPKNHRLFVLGMHDNIGKVVLTANIHDTTRLILRYALTLILETCQSSSEDFDHVSLQKTLKATILDAFQVSQTPQAKAKTKVGTKDSRFTDRWIASKVFLNHSLLDSLVDLNETHFGPHFTLTVTTLESLFHKTEWLPVSFIQLLMNISLLIMVLSS